MTDKDKQEWNVITKGGQREEIVLCGQTLIIGELPIKNRGIIFECMEADMYKYEIAQRDYLNKPAPGLIGAFAAMARVVTGRQKKAVGIMKTLTNGITRNDYRLIKVCVIPFNGFWMRFQIRSLFWNATFTEIQEAVKKIFDINHIETKKHPATRTDLKSSSQSVVAQSSTDGTPASSCSPAGHVNK